MPDRSSGVLLHPTSLPGRHGIGDLGREARRFVDRLAGAGVALWQMLPITAPGAFGSPYDCRSAFAGNWLLISPEQLVAEGLLRPRSAVASLPAATLDLPAASEHKEALLRASWDHFRHRARSADRRRFEAFRHAEEQTYWLEDWALFSALDAKFDQRPWNGWPVALRDREPDALRQAGRQLADEVEYQIYLQYLFSSHYRALHDHARSRGVRLCGDLPMYLAHHSADVWAHQELFELDAQGDPAAVAGVPPDAFSDGGQLWGNPVYRWHRHRELGFAWWIRRLQTQAGQFEMLRLDHFRGFVAHWRVPLPATDARGGRWVRGPGQSLFDAWRAELGDLDLIAEDLGHITPAVVRLRRRLGLPGMKVLQFAFDQPTSVHRPDRYDATTVAYTGTHDNDTLAGWCEALDPEARARVTRYLGSAALGTSTDLARHLIRRLLESEACLTIIPAQDLLGLGSEARMNTPGTAYDNWRWRMADGALDEPVLERLARLLTQTDRSTKAREAAEHG